MLRRSPSQTSLWLNSVPPAVAEYKGMRLVDLADLSFGQWRQFCALYRHPLLAELNQATPLRSPTLLMASSFMKDQGQRRLTFAIMLHNGKVIGSVELYNFEPSIKTAERATLGIMLHPDHWEKGFGAKALCALLCMAFAYGPTIEFANSEICLERIALHTLRNNERAIGLFRKLGFLEEGPDNSNHGELLHMRLRRNEWMQRVDHGNLP